MGLLIDDAVAIIKGHQNIIANGNVICLGRPKIYFTSQEINSLSKKLGIKWNPINDKINAEIFFKNLGYKRMIVIDNSFYEKPNFTIDLNNSIENLDLKCFADLIIDCGTSHYIFDTKVLFENIFFLLKPQGSVYHSVPVNGYYDQGYYQFSPSLLLDLYRDEFEIYSANFFDPSNQKKIINYQRNNYYNNSNLKSSKLIFSLFVNKLNRNTQFKHPQFEYYRNSSIITNITNKSVYDKRNLLKKLYKFLWVQ